MDTTYVTLTRWNPNLAEVGPLPADVVAAIEADEPDDWPGDVRARVLDAITDMVCDETARLCAEQGITVEWVNFGEQVFRGGQPGRADDARYAYGDEWDPDVKMPDAVRTAIRFHHYVIEGGGSCDWDATARAAVAEGSEGS